MKEHEGSSNLNVIDSLFFESIEQKNYNKVLYNIMLNILNETKKMKECLLRRKKSIVLEYISVCSTVVEESIMKVMKWTDQVESVKPHSSVVTDVYHTGIGDSGEIQK